LIASHQEDRHAGTSNATTVPEVLQDMIGNIEEIIRSEFRVAKTELSEKASDAAQSAKLSVFYGLGFLLLAAVYASAVIMSIWLGCDRLRPPRFPTRIHESQDWTGLSLKTQFDQKIYRKKPKSPKRIISPGFCGLRASRSY
jgi:hypothetical protein